MDSIDPFQSNYTVPSVHMMNENGNALRAIAIAPPTPPSPTHPHTYIHTDTHTHTDTNIHTEEEQVTIDSLTYMQSTSSHLSETEGGVVTGIGGMGGVLSVSVSVSVSASLTDSPASVSDSSLSLPQLVSDTQLQSDTSIPTDELPITPHKVDMDSMSMELKEESVSVPKKESTVSSLHAIQVESAAEKKPLSHPCTHDIDDKQTDVAADDPMSDVPTVQSSTLVHGGEEGKGYAEVKSISVGQSIPLFGPNVSIPAVAWSRTLSGSPFDPTQPFHSSQQTVVKPTRIHMMEEHKINEMEEDQQGTIDETSTDARDESVPVELPDVILTHTSGSVLAESIEHAHPYPVPLDPSEMSTPIHSSNVVEPTELEFDVTQPSPLPVETDELPIDIAVSDEDMHVHVHVELPTNELPEETVNTAVEEEAATATDSDVITLHIAAALEVERVATSELVAKLEAEHASKEASLHADIIEHVRAREIAEAALSAAQSKSSQDQQRLEAVVSALEESTRANANALESQLSIANADLMHMRIQAGQHADGLAEMDRKLAAQTDISTQQQHQLSMQMDELSKLSMDLSTVTHALQQKESVCAQHIQLIQDQKVELHTLRIQAAPTQHLIEARDLELRGKSAQLNEAQSKLLSVQYRVEELEEELKQASMANRRLEKDIKSTNAEASEAKLIAERAEMALEPMHQEGDALRKQVAELIAELNSARKEFTVAENARMELESSMKKLNVSLQVESANVGELTAQLNTSQTDYAKQVSEYESLVKKHSELTDRMTANSSTQQSIQTAINTYRSQKQELLRRNTDLNTRLELNTQTHRKQMHEEKVMREMAQKQQLIAEEKKNELEAEKHRLQTELTRLQKIVDANTTAAAHVAATGHIVPRAKVSLAAVLPSAINTVNMAPSLSSTRHNSIPSVPIPVTATQPLVVMDVMVPESPTIDSEVQIMELYAKEESKGSSASVSKQQQIRYAQPQTREIKVQEAQVLLEESKQTEVRNEYMRQQHWMTCQFSFISLMVSLFVLLFFVDFLSTVFLLSPFPLVLCHYQLKTSVHVNHQRDYLLP
jgi:hypothetical protein